MPKANRHRLIGKTYNHWRIVGVAERPRQVIAECLLCRTKYERQATSITSGLSRQCKSCAVSKTSTSHGLSRSRTAASWYKMRQRGPFVARWDDLETFIADVGRRPKGKVLYRPDTSKPWGPGNAEWTTRAEVARRTRKRQPPRDIGPMDQLGPLQVEILRMLSRYRMARQGSARSSIIAQEVERDTSTTCDCLMKLRRRGLARKRDGGWELDPDGLREAMAA